jgi:hypothetical protein
MNRIIAAAIKNPNKTRKAANGAASVGSFIFA